MMMDQQEQRRIQRCLEQYASSIGKRIYKYIKQSPLTKAELRKKTSLPAKLLDDQLQKLSEYNLIKAIKKADKKNLNVWVLFHEKEEQEQEEDMKKNLDLIALIKSRCVTPHGRHNSSTIHTLSQLKKQAIRKAIDLSMFEQILQMMSAKGQIILSEGEGEKKIYLKQFKKYNYPCLNCELRRICRPSGTINPSICPYMTDW